MGFLARPLPPRGTSSYAYHIRVYICIYIYTSARVRDTIRVGMYMHASGYERVYTQPPRHKRGVGVKLIQPTRLPSSRAAENVNRARRKCTDRFCITPRRDAMRQPQKKLRRRRRGAQWWRSLLPQPRCRQQSGIFDHQRGIRWMNISQFSPPPPLPPSPSPSSSPLAASFLSPFLPALFTLREND